VNIESVMTLLEVIRGTSTRLVHLSIDLVFSGTRGGGHIETDPTDPVTVYGKTMAEAEQIIVSRSRDTEQCEQKETKETKTSIGVSSANGPLGSSSLPSFPSVQNLSAAVLRISLPMGISFNGHAGAIDWIQHRFKKGKPATLYYDEIRTPTYTDCLNPLLAEVLARRDITGLFHAGGPRRLSLFQIAQIVNRVGGYDPGLLHGCMRIEAGPLPPRAGDVSMDSSKLTLALGHHPFDPWPLDHIHVPTDRHWHFKSPHGSPELLGEVLYRNPRRHKRTGHALANV
jgi:dTDP-4-dehydrorhamnose reductase